MVRALLWILSRADLKEKRDLEEAGRNLPYLKEWGEVAVRERRDVRTQQRIFMVLTLHFTSSD